VTPRSDRSDRRTDLEKPASGSVTLRDVARAAQVRPGTASRALNNATRDLVNSATAQRIERAAVELGYRSNAIARGLKTNRSYTIGVQIPDLTNPLFPRWCAESKTDSTPRGTPR
jgi:LacI family transcriptional regulator